MQTIFVMVKSALGKAYEVADTAINQIEQISEIHSISGEYDLLIKCYLKDDDDIGQFITQELQMIAGVTNTFTLIAFKAF